jgi:hypothetical protein
VHCWTHCSGSTSHTLGDRFEGDEEYTCSRSFEVQGIVKAHLLVLGFFRRRGLLGLCPLRDEVSDGLGFNGLTWVELKFELAVRWTT